MKLANLTATLSLLLGSAFILRGEPGQSDPTKLTIFGANEIAARWVKQLAATDPAQADEAVIKIMALGPIAIDELMRACDSEEAFHGLCMYAEIDAAPRALRVNYVALYLIRSILSDDNPGRHRFYSPSDMPVQQATQIYKEWYEEVLQHREKLLDINKYLKRHGLAWGGA